HLRGDVGRSPRLGERLPQAADDEEILLDRLGSEVVRLHLLLREGDRLVPGRLPPGYARREGLPDQGDGGVRRPLPVQLLGREFLPPAVRPPEARQVIRVTVPPLQR